MKKSHQENNQSKHRTERERRWWRNRTGRPPSPQQMYQNIICMWNSSHRTSLEHCQKTPDLQKGKPILEWGRAKDKRQKRRQIIWDGDLHPGDRVVKEKRFLHTRKTPHKQGQGRGASEPQREEQRDRCAEGKMEKLHHWDRTWLSRLWQAGAGCGGSGLGIGP